MRERRRYPRSNVENVDKRSLFVTILRPERLIKRWTV